METGITNINEKLMSIKPIDTAAVDELSSSLNSLKACLKILAILLKSIVLPLGLLLKQSPL